MKLVRKSHRFLIQHTILGDLSRAADFRLARRRLMGSGTLSGREKALLAQVSLRVHPRDEMYAAAEPYLSVGLSALRCIEDVLAKAKESHEVRTILDFPCGYGRVLRFLRVKFPAAEITASELNPVALDFCERLFSVKLALSNADFRGLALPDRYDLIWCGSLVTHIQEWKTAALLKFFHDHLSPGGLCVFTTHGQVSADWIQKKTQTYGLTDSAQQQVVSQFHRTGFGYTDYSNQQEYGIALVSHERMLAIARSAGQWNEVCYLEHGWGDHQDVYAFAVPTSNKTPQRASSST
jgi:SAM-dependent methyltransferase